MSNKLLTTAALAVVIATGAISTAQAADKEKYHDVSAAFQNDSAHFSGDKAAWNNTSIRAKSILMRQEKKR